MGYAKYSEDNWDYYYDNDFLRKDVVIANPLNNVSCPYCHKSFKNLIDVWNHVKQNHSKNPICFFKENNEYQRVVTYTLDSVCNEVIDRCVSGWNNQLGKGEKIGLRGRHTSIDDVANRYLDGIYNYFVSCENRGMNRNLLLNNAIGILRSYDTIDRRGAFILQIIAYQFNWIDSLKCFCNVYHDDIFSQLLKFYDGNWNRISYVEEKDDSKRIYIPDDDSEYINMVVQFLNQNIEVVRNYLNKLFVEDIFDLNLRDRVYFLMACVAKKDGNKDEINNISNKIISRELLKKIRRIANEG